MMMQSKKMKPTHHDVPKDGLLNTVSASFNIITGQMTEISQRKKTDAMECIHHFNPSFGIKQSERFLDKDINFIQFRSLHCVSQHHENSLIGFPSDTITSCCFTSDSFLRSCVTSSCKSWTTFAWRCKTTRVCVRCKATGTVAATATHTTDMLTHYTHVNTRYKCQHTTQISTHQIHDNTQHRYQHTIQMSTHHIHVNTPDTSQHTTQISTHDTNVNTPHKCQHMTCKSTHDTYVNTQHIYQHMTHMSLDDTDVNTPHICQHMTQ